jgi:hypothetical protein
LLGISPRTELGLFEQPYPARQVLEYLLPAGLIFYLTTARLLERGPLTLQFLLLAPQLCQLLLGLGDS